MILVGNAASLLDKQLGEFIDAHESVVRMNNGGPLPDKASDLGLRTTHWSFSATDRTQYLYWRGKLPTDVIELRLNRRIVYPIGNSESISPTQLVYDRMLKNYAGARPSTGAITAAWLCGVMRYKVTAVGFDFFQSRTWYRDSDARGPHDSDQEKAFLENMTNLRVMQ
jgi:hypothetical protein